MNNVLLNRYVHGRGPGREQNLFISQSKHLYLTKSGNLRRQEKPLDPRIPGAKSLLTRLAILDVDTGSVYGEYHDEETSKDLIGFLARAWSKKAMHPMRGVPQILNVPAVALKDQAYREDLEFAIRHTSLQLGELPSGFSAGVHALKQLERCVESLMYHGRQGEVDLYLIHMASAVVSCQASNSLSHTWNQKWEGVAPVDRRFLDAVDALYEEPGAWRSGPFEIVLNGLPAKA